MSKSTPAAAPWRTHTMRIAAIRPEIEGVATYDLVFSQEADAKTYDFLPGQFNMLYLPGIGESAISLCGPCGEARWRHTVRVAGRVTQTMSQLQVGSQIGVRGPFGHGWPVENWRGQDIVLIAGGIGLPPLRPAIYEMLRRRNEYGQLTLIYGAREPRSLLYTDEFADWESKDLEVQLTADRASAGWSGHQGVVTTLLDRLSLPRPERTVVAVCGPEVMIRYACLSVLRRAISDQQVWVSLERNMQCAVGFCGHCQLGPEFICKDGPVLRYDRVGSLLSVEAL